MSRNKAIFILPLLISLIIGVIWTVFSVQFLNQGILWDLGIYEKAVLIFNSGSNPYEPNFYMSTISPGIGHLFIYQPLILRGMALFGQQLGIVMILLYVGSLLFFIQSLGNRRAWWFASFFAFAYCGLGTVSIGSGNVTTFLHLILISFLLRNISRDQITFTAFVVAVILFSLVKPYLIVYLMIPLALTFQTSLQKRVWQLTVAAGFIFTGTIIGSWLYFGEEFQAFITAVRTQTIDKHDLGHGIVMYFYEYYRSAGSLIYRAYLLHFVILGVFILGTLLLAKRSNLLNKSNFALLLYFLLTILNPRLKVYDLFPALLALFIYASAFNQSKMVKALFVIAYSLSLSQLVGTPFFAHTGILSDPLNVYYLTMGLVFLGALPKLLQKPNHALRI
jgi:hypothetical protein